MRDSRKTIALGCCQLGLSIILQAQGVSPKVFMETQWMPAADMEDTTGEFSTNSYKLGFSVPVRGKVMPRIDTERPSFYALFVNGQVTFTQYTIEPFSSDRLGITPWIGSSFLYFNGKKSVFLGNIRALLLEDEFTISQPKLKPAGLLVWRYQASPSFSYQLGITYTYNLGMGLPFPVLGGSKIFNERARLTVTLPLMVQYHCKLSDTFYYQVFMQPDGSITRFQNNGMFEQQDKILLLRQRAMQFGVLGTYVYHRFQLHTEIGLLGIRSISFSEEESTMAKLRNLNFLQPSHVYHTGIAPRLYANLTLRINLAKRSGQLDLLNSVEAAWMGFD
ncbi:MAG: DUF6268 family outer membrane beta-barrel protein [Cyclobacteriaceae bacterium]